jgi:hypothetical protein
VTGGLVPQTPRYEPSAVPEMHQIPKNLTTYRLSSSNLCRIFEHLSIPSSCCLQYICMAYLYRLTYGTGRH